MPLITPIAGGGGGLRVLITSTPVGTGEPIGVGSINLDVGRGASGLRAIRRCSPSYVSGDLNGPVEVDKLGITDVTSTVSGCGDKDTTTAGVESPAQNTARHSRDFFGIETRKESTQATKVTRRVKNIDLLSFIDNLTFEQTAFSFSYTPSSADYGEILIYKVYV